MRKKILSFLILIMTAILVVQIWPSGMNVNAETDSPEGLKVTITPNKPAVDVNGPDNEVTFKVTVTNKGICLNPLDIVTIFDHSLSMQEDRKEPPAEPITTAKVVTKEFIDSLDPEQDRVGIVAYNHFAKLISPLSSNFNQAKNSLNPLQANGATNIMAAFDTASAELDNARSGVDRIIVFFSDGSANRPENTGTDPEELARQAAARAKAKGIRVISVALGKLPKNLDVESMKQFASSPSDYFYAYDTNDMTEVYRVISKELKGASPDTVVKVYIGEHLDKMEFVSASNNARKENGYLIWNLGDLSCDDLRELEFVMRPNPDLTYPTTVDYAAEVTNSSGDSDKSDPAEVDILAPNLSIDVTDNRTIAQIGEELTYEVSVTNDGSAPAYGVKVCNTIPPQVEQIEGSATDDGQTEGDNITCWIVDLEPGETIKLYVKGIVREDIPEGYTDIYDNAVLYYKKQIKDAKDKTQIFKKAIPDPDYELSSCLIQDGSSDHLTAYFGYENNLDIPQNLDRSNSDIGQVIGNIPQVLLSGNHEGVFYVVFGIDEVVTWSTKAGNTEKSIQAAVTTPDCDLLSVSLPVEPTPEEEFIGTPVVKTDPSEGENVAPKVVLNDLNKINSCEEGQRITATLTAEDGDGVIASAQYSLNNGRNWHPITKISGLGTKTAVAEFTTKDLEDRTYKVKVRALDNNGNIGSSQVKEVNIDCEGIVIGSTQFNQLGQLSPLSSRGVVSSFANQQLYMAIAISGGPSKAVVVSENVITGKLQTFTLEYNDEIELWETNLEFGDAGLYSLEVKASEEDEEVTSRSTNSVQVYAAGKTVDQDGKQLENATTTLYFRPSRDLEWQVWNAEAFGQVAKQDAEFGYFIEPGFYYLEASAPGHFTSRTVEFEAQNYGILAEDVILYANSNPFNWFGANQIYMAPTPVNDQLTDDLKGLVNKVIPEIQLLNENGVLSTQNIIDAHTPTVLVTWTDWGTISSAQLEQLSELAQTPAVQNGEVRLIAVGLLEGREENEAQLLRGDYGIEFYKPADLSFFDKLFVISAPQYYLLNSNGEIRDIQVGNRYAADILDSLEEANKYEPTDNEIL